MYTFRFLVRTFRQRGLSPIRTLPFNGYRGVLQPSPIRYPAVPTVVPRSDLRPMLHARPMDAHRTPVLSSLTTFFPTTFPVYNVTRSIISIDSTTFAPGSSGSREACIALVPASVCLLRVTRLPWVHSAFVLMFR